MHLAVRAAGVQAEEEGEEQEAQRDVEARGVDLRTVGAGAGAQGCALLTTMSLYAAHSVLMVDHT